MSTCCVRLEWPYPSLNRGNISVTFIGTLEGRARLTKVRGSYEESF